MNTKLKQIYKIIPFAELCLSVLLLLVTLFIKDIPENKSYYYIDKQIISSSWHNDYDNVTACLALIFIAAFFIYLVVTIARKISHKELSLKYLNIMIICSFFSIGLIIVCSVLVNGIWTRNDYYPECFEYSDRNRTIVIEEESFLLYGGATIYQIKDNNEAVIIGSFSTDDGGRNNGKYDIQWFDDRAEITFNTFTDRGSRSTISVKFV